MNKTQQSAYHNILQGFQNMADEILIPRLEPEELYNVFFQLRLDHPEIFWATGFRYKYYQDSPNLIFVPEYLFEKNKVKEHQRAMQARVEKLVRPVKDKSEWQATWNWRCPRWKQLYFGCTFSRMLPSASL